MQEIITYIIGLIAAFIIGRWIWQIAKGRKKGGCISCDACNLRGGCDKSK